MCICADNMRRFVPEARLHPYLLRLPAALMHLPFAWEIRENFGVAILREIA